MLTVELSEPWFAISDADTRHQLEAELQRELSHGHELAGEPARAIARPEDRDHVLFALGSSGWAIVHLTYKDESDAAWPVTRLFRTEEDLDAQPRQDRNDFESR